MSSTPLFSSGRSRYCPIEPDEHGDFDSPVLKKLREAWNGYLESSLDEDDVLLAISEARAEVDLQIDRLQAQVDSGVSDTESPLFRGIAQAFMTHLEALDLMVEEFHLDPEDPDYENFFEQGYELAQEATNRLMQVHENTLKKIEESAWFNCPGCGSRNLRSNERCHSCFETMPQRLELIDSNGRQSYFAVEVRAGATGGGGVTENYLMVAEAVEGWLTNKRPVSSLMQVLQKVGERMSIHLQENSRLLQTMEGGSSKEQAVREALLGTEESVSQSLESLEKLIEAFTETRPSPAVVRVRLVKFEQVSKRVAESYYALKRAYEMP